VPCYSISIGQIFTRKRSKQIATKKYSQITWLNRLDTLYSLWVVCYLHEIAGDKCGAPCTSGLTVNINLLSARNMFHQKLHAISEFLLCRGRNQVRCAENQLCDAKLRPLLPPQNNFTLNFEELETGKVSEFPSHCFVGRQY